MKIAIAQIFCLSVLFAIPIGIVEHHFKIPIWGDIFIGIVCGFGVSLFREWIASTPSAREGKEGQ